MATINFTQPLYTDETKQYLYSDLHLDLAEQSIYSKSGESQNKVKSDIKADYNIDAIKNSLTNLFLTRQGNRILYPEFYTNLEQYLFEPVTTSTAHRIGTEIEDVIRKYEPRITPIEINVSILPTHDGYNIDLVLFVPSLSINTVVNVSANIAEGFVVK